MSAYQQFLSQVAPKLQKDLDLKNVMQVPRLTKIKINVGIGSLGKKIKDFSGVIENVSKITGQKPVITKAKLAVSNFKLRKDMPVGITVTLRGEKMYNFVYRLVNIVLPRVRDFRGISPKSFDGKGNYSLGFKEATVFPEINPDDVSDMHGLQVTFCTSAKDNAAGHALLEQLGFPFKK